MNIGLVFTRVARRDANMERWSSSKLVTAVTGLGSSAAWMDGSLACVAPETWTRKRESPADLEGRRHASPDSRCGCDR